MTGGVAVGATRGRIEVLDWLKAERASVPHAITVPINLLIRGDLRLITLLGESYLLLIIRHFYSLLIIYC